MDDLKANLPESCVTEEFIIFDFWVFRHAQKHDGAAQYIHKNYENLKWRSKGENRLILTRDDTFRVVCNLRTPTTTSAGKSTEIVGTGIFMSDKNDMPWIITASHVAKSTTTHSKIAIGDENCDCHLLLLTKLNSQLAWIHHQIADISALPVILSPENMPYLKGRCLPYDHFNLQKTSVSRDFELTTVGFPKGLGVTGKFSPLTFRSYASSGILTLNRADTNSPSEFFCMENPSMGGYSGGPVFDLGYMVVGAMTTTKKKTICYGIIHGTMSDNTGGKIAMVTPTYYLKDIVTP